MESQKIQPKKSELKKLRDDTLKNADGKYSRKSISAFVSFGMAVLLAIHIVLSDFYLPEVRELNVYVIIVFSAFLTAGAATLGLTVIDKLKTKTND